MIGDNRMPGGSQVGESDGSLVSLGRCWVLLCYLLGGRFVALGFKVKHIPTYRKKLKLGLTGICKI